VPAIVLVSAKGSPGVTTAAAALAAAGVAASGRALLAELDPSGGSVQVLASGPAAWGLIDAAGRLRRETGAEPVRDNLTELPPGVSALLAPTAGHSAESVIASTDRWLASLRAAAPDVVVDGGRWEASQPTSHRIAGADLVGLVCRPTVGGIETARLALERLRAAARAPVVVVVVGRKPYRPEEIAGHLDVPLGGTLAWDPRGVGALWVGGATGSWRRSALAKSARVTGARLADLAHRAHAHAAGHQPPPPPSRAGVPGPSPSGARS
jgi:Flp pilus assembly CpaE family ATPase